MNEVALQEYLAEASQQEEQQYPVNELVGRLNAQPGGHRQDIPAAIRLNISYIEGHAERKDQLCAQRNLPPEKSKLLLPVHDRKYGGGNHPNGRKHHNLNEAKFFQSLLEERDGVADGNAPDHAQPHHKMNR